MSQKGFIKILIIAIVVIIIGAIGYFTLVKKPPTIPSEEQKTYIPSEEEITPADETPDWQTYRNEEYGFEVKYPNTLSKGGEYAPCTGDEDFICNDVLYRIWRRNPKEDEWEEFKVEIDKNRYSSFTELWTEQSEIANRGCESIEKLSNFEGIKKYNCVGQRARVQVAIILKNDLTFTMYYINGTEIDGKDRFNQILSTFKFIE